MIDNAALFQHCKIRELLAVRHNESNRLIQPVPLNLNDIKTHQKIAGMHLIPYGALNLIAVTVQAFRADADCNEKFDAVGCCDGDGIACFADCRDLAVGRSKYFLLKRLDPASPAFAAVRERTVLNFFSEE